MSLWLNDPKDKVPSVSLTLLVVSFILVCTLVTLDALGKVKSTSVSMEIFGFCVANYFGRRLNLNGKTFSVEKNDVK